VVDDDDAKFFGGRTRTRLGAGSDPSNVTRCAAGSAAIRHIGVADCLRRVRTRVTHDFVRLG